MPSGSGSDEIRTVQPLDNSPRREKTFGFQFFQEMVAVAESSIPRLTVEHGDHMCVLYGTDEEYRGILMAHLVTALERDEMVRFLIDSSTLEMIDSWLSPDDPDPGFPIARNQLTTRLVDDVILADGVFEPDRLTRLLSEESAVAACADYSGLRVCLQASWASNGAGSHERLLDLERQVSSLLTDSWPVGVALVCHYDRRGIPPQRLGDIQRVHATALDAGPSQERRRVLDITPLRNRVGLRFDGDIDRSNFAEFHAALKSIQRDNHDLYLDLSSVHYADVAVVGLLAETASAMPAGERLVLHSPPPVVRTTLRTYGWDQLPALVIQWETADE